ncbi:helix-turn-helix domain-containing protein [Aequorivita marina]|uniref:helix-turn-helix domain-containing protein n=1 Tax=Aequorivita marina TaxID=3073654 RepID=UPI00287683F8|nr:helix-turn-helix domain-containing protein [Aequorivita sp. S2608]MDS1299203.1 helix-turn-helix domain-containing protein [Aequorivita sp. S2608]
MVSKIKHYINELQTNENDVYLTRTETAEFFKINSSTLWHWTKQRKLKSYEIGNRRYYNKMKLIETLKKNELRHSSISK